MGALAEPGIAALIDRAALLLGPVQAVERAPGGYTGQRVLRLRLAASGSAVLKAAAPSTIRGGPDMRSDLEREIELYASHPELDRWRPRQHAVLDAGGWLGLLMEDLAEGVQPPPWTAEHVQFAAAGLGAMHASTEAGGVCVVHGDVRSDNLFIVPERGLVLCDWADATTGIGVQDAAYWAVGVELDGCVNAPEAYAVYAALPGTATGATLPATLRQLALHLHARAGREDTTALVRDLRRRELAVLTRWMHALDMSSDYRDTAVAQCEVATR